MATVTDLTLRVTLTADQHKLIEAAAELFGQDIAAYAASAALERARRTIAAHRGIRLSDRDRDYFLGLLDNPPEPGPRLRRAAQQHDKNIIP